ncbi:unnamed protein product [Schistocephalus solidus]|uniref:Uncharacterized protein n=1 Tax=Schistocephalus solidus TaxID=70667 RepID=A0A183TKU3_SCHSO|nr:unnamed protein product [Schistocephalus solidus]
MRSNIFKQYQLLLSQLLPRYTLEKCRTPGLHARPRKTTGRLTFAAIKAAYGCPIKETALLCSDKGATLLTEKTQILKRWVECFRCVTTRPSTLSDDTIDRLPLQETNVDLDLLPSLYETIRALQKLSSG